MFVSREKPQFIRVTFRGPGVKETFLVDRSTSDEITMKLDGAMKETYVVTGQSTDSLKPRRKYTRTAKVEAGAGTWPKETA